MYNSADSLVTMPLPLMQITLAHSHQRHTTPAGVVAATHCFSQSCRSHISWTFSFIFFLCVFFFSKVVGLSGENGSQHCLHAYYNVRTTHRTNRRDDDSDDCVVIGTRNLYMKQGDALIATTPFWKVPRRRAL